MSNAKKCDICGEFYTENKAYKLDGYFINRLAWITERGRYPKDVCDECLDFYYAQVPNLLAEARNGSKNANTIIDVIRDFNESLDYSDNLLKEMKNAD